MKREGTSFRPSVSRGVLSQASIVTTCIQREELAAERKHETKVATNPIPYHEKPEHYRIFNGDLVLADLEDDNATAQGTLTKQRIVFHTLTGVDTAPYANSLAMLMRYAPVGVAVFDEKPAGVGLKEPFTAAIGGTVAMRNNGPTAIDAGQPVMVVLPHPENMDMSNGINTDGAAMINSGSAGGQAFPYIVAGNSEDFRLINVLRSMLLSETTNVLEEAYALNPAQRIENIFGIGADENVMSVERIAGGFRFAQLAMVARIMETLRAFGAIQVVGFPDTAESIYGMLGLNGAANFDAVRNEVQQAQLAEITGERRRPVTGGAGPALRSLLQSPTEHALEAVEDLQRVLKRACIGEALTGGQPGSSLVVNLKINSY